MAAAEASRRLRERGDRRDRGRAAVGDLREDGGGERRQQEFLAEQPAGVGTRRTDARRAAGARGRRYDETRCGTDPICSRAAERSFFSLSKLARRIASESSTHSTSSTSLSCGVSCPPTYCIR